MRKTMLLMAVTLAASASSAWAADDANGNVSSTTPPSTSSGLLRDEVVGVAPEAGILGYAYGGGNYTSRGVAGLGLEFNISSVASDAMKDTYLGIQTGLLYSHVGTGNSDFFGANPNYVTTDPGANILLIPADLKVGWNTFNNARLSIHGGGNVLYRSVANSMEVGDSSSLGDTSVWRIYPNAGVDLEWGFQSVSLLLRPDFTFTPGSTIYGATLGLNIELS